MADEGSVSGGFKSGFGGCFGVLAAILLSIVAVYACARLNDPPVTDASSAGSSEAAIADQLPALMARNPSAYCATAFRAAQRQVPALADHTQSLDAPRRTTISSPDRATCFANDEHGYRAVQYTFDVVCDDPGAARCVRLVSIIDGRGVLFVDQGSLDRAAAEATHN